MYRSEINKVLNELIDINDRIKAYNEIDILNISLEVHLEAEQNRLTKLLKEYILEEEGIYLI